MVNNGPVAVALKFGGTLGGSAGLQALIDAIVGRQGATVDDVPAALVALAAGGDPAAVAALVQAAVDGLDLSGLVTPCPVDEAAVQALIDAAVAALPPDALDEAAVRAVVGAALAATVMPILDGHTTDLAGLNTGLANVRTLVAGLVDEVSALVVGGDGVQPLLDLLAVKPGATVADVAEVWEALSNTSVGFAQLLATLSGKPLSQDPTVADVQAGLPVLIQTIVDQGVPGQIDAAIDASVTSGAIGTAISGLYSQLYNDDIVPLKTAVEQGFPYVQGELDKQGGRLTALEAAALGGGDGVSQAVVDSLLARLDALEVENAALKVRVQNSEDVLGVTGGTIDQLQQNDADIVEFMSTKLVTTDYLDGLEGAIINQFGAVGAQVAEAEKLIRDVMDAMNGPNATAQGITEMFWLLNDVLTALIEATGIELPGKVN